MEILAKEIAKIRKEKGITQAELAKAVGVNQQTVCEWERNRNNPNLETFCKIVEYLECSPNDLLGF